MVDYASKLETLGYRLFKASDAAASVNADALLAQLPLNFPEDYRNFLTAFPRTGVFDEKVVFSGIQASPWASNGLEVLEVLYGYCSSKNNDIAKVREQYLSQVPAHFLAIGQVTGANLVCLDLRQASFGRVYVWDHEHLGGSDEGFYLAAPSFSAFFESLKVAEEQPATGGPKLVKMQLSDTLRARAAEILKNREKKS